MVLLCNDELSDPAPASASSRRYPLRKTTARDVEKGEPEPERNKMSKIHNKRKLQMPDPAHVLRNVIAHSTTVEKSAYTMVTETLRTFNKLYLKCIQANYFTPPFSWFITVWCAVVSALPQTLRLIALFSTKHCILSFKL